MYLRWNCFFPTAQSIATVGIASSPDSHSCPALPCPALPCLAAQVVLRTCRYAWRNATPRAAEGSLLPCHATILDQAKRVGKTQQDYRDRTPSHSLCGVPLIRAAPSYKENCDSHFFSFPTTFQTTVCSIPSCSTSHLSHLSLALFLHTTAAMATSTTVSYTANVS